MTRMDSTLVIAGSAADKPDAHLPREYRSVRKNLILVSAILLAQQSAEISVVPLVPVKVLDNLEIRIGHETVIPYTCAVLAVYLTYLLSFEWRHIAHGRKTVIQKLDYRGTDWFGIFVVQVFCLKEIIAAFGLWAGVGCLILCIALRGVFGPMLKKGGPSPNQTIRKTGWFFGKALFG